MNKDNYVKDYIEATKAYYLFMMGNFFDEEEWKNYILESRYLSGAKVSFISNIMLGIKEDIVKNRGELQYESRLFVNSLEQAVLMIAKYDGNNYLLDNFSFPDAASLVAIVRNKLAHGKYVIDFDNNKIILRHKCQDISIDIDKLVNFVMVAFMNMLKEQEKTQYVRDICVFKTKEKQPKKRLTVLSDVRNVIKNIHVVSFNLFSKTDKKISKDAIQVLEDFISYYNISPELALMSDLYKRTCVYLRRNGYDLSIGSKSLNNREAIDNMVKMFSEQTKNLNLDYSEQIKLIMPEVQRKIKGDYNNFNPIASNISHLIILDGINKTKSTNFDKLSEYVTNMGIDNLKFSYDELGMSIISMFNAIFLYPLEDVFVSNGGYKIDRSLEFDFAALDLSMLNPSVISINEIPKDLAFQKYMSTLKRKEDIDSKIDVQKNNLKNVLGNLKAEVAINNNISQLQNAYSIAVSDLIDAKLEYDLIDKDYKGNYEYFRNISIIEGIRNAIAHGNYKIYGNIDIMNSKMVFEDIYEGKLTFKLEVTYNEFLDFLENNIDLVVQYVSGNKKVK